MKNTNEKADNIIVLQMVFAATANQNGFQSLVITRMCCCVVLHYLAQKLEQFAQYQQYLLCTDGS